MPDSIRERVARLLLVGFQGSEPDSDAREFLETTTPCGVILFKQNIASQEGVAAAIAGIQERCAHGGPPLLVGIDQEGGRVVRLTGEVGFPTFPSARELAGQPDPVAAVRSAMEVTARGLKRLGINFDFAPVLDVVTDPDNRVIGDRSYGANPEVVETLGCAAILALQENGVAAAGKHFPGHGPTAVDSHLDLPCIPLSRAEMDRVHLRPFKKAIEAGAAALMTAHAVYPAYDPDAPATLSRTILTGTLREELGFDGAIITDSLTMQAIARRQPVPEACVRAIEAGCDILMVPSSPVLQRECVLALEQAVEAGRVSAGRIEQSLIRIDRLRRRFAVA